jgi:hypothetical protein
VGASTITQQVAKNKLLTNEVSLERKAKEAILALRIEESLSKRRILELYLNEIYLGFGAYGVASAATNYFDRSLDELSLAQLSGQETVLAWRPELSPVSARPLPAVRPQRREGVGVIEAPRGTLIHRYRVGDDDLVAECDLVVSTTHNNRAMNESVLAVAREVFDGRELTEPMLNRIEVAVRAYDPCLSCATHALGSMPLEVRLLGADGAQRDRVLRHADGRLERPQA